MYPNFLLVSSKADDFNSLISINGKSNNDVFWNVNANIELMQFTGLRDKNGNEIYEGDILKTATFKPMAVHWISKFASFCINSNGWSFSHYFGEGCDPEDCEIIGNIWENPELLEAT